ncbi:MAG: hypothetical protein Q8O28_00485 [Smithellaceae bacterium]|nr:hypothetical protein [Smithellaceae bacterium]
MACKNLLIRRNQKLFVMNELWTMAWAGSVQRANLYKKNADINSEDVKRFRDSLIKYIKAHLIPQYFEGCSEEQHYGNIESLIEQAKEDVGQNILTDGSYRYGIAQKLLNLALKYYWCLGEINAPPHCPVDSIVINQTKYKDEIKWTKIRERSEYQKIIEAIKEKATEQQLSIPEWELELFNKRFG